MLYIYIERERENKVASGVISRMHRLKADYIHTKCDAAYLIDVCHPVVVLAVVVIFQW